MGSVNLEVMQEDLGGGGGGRRDTDMLTLTTLGSYPTVVLGASVGRSIGPLHHQTFSRGCPCAQPAQKLPAPQPTPRLTERAPSAQGSCSQILGLPGNISPSLLACTCSPFSH